MLPRLLVSALLTLLLADSALATTASVAPGGVLHVTTAAGEANAIAIERDAAGPVLVRETGAVPLVAGANCQDRPDLGAVLCLGVSALDVDTGDGDDRVTVADAEGFADQLPATVAGGDGADQLVAGESATTLRGGHGDDTLIGGPEADTFDGGTGNDEITGGAGDDAIAGGDGDDALDGGAGFDTLAGGDGTDVARYLDAAVHVVTLGGDGDDRVAGDIEVVLGGPAADTLSGTAAAERLAGADGADVLGGGAGDDVLEGGAGADRLTGGAGADTVDAGDGDDVIDVLDGEPDTVVCGPGDDRVTSDLVDTVTADCEHAGPPSALVPTCSGLMHTAGRTAPATSPRRIAARRVSCSLVPCPSTSATWTRSGCVEPPDPCRATRAARGLACAPPPGAITVEVAAKRKQAAGRRIAIAVRCSIACEASARASAKARGRRYRMRAPGRAVPAERTVTLRMRVPRALAGRKLKIVVTARDAAGRRATKEKTIRLRRR